MNKKIDKRVSVANARGFVFPFLLFFVSMIFIGKSYFNVDNNTLRVKGEIVSIAKDSTSLKIQMENTSFKLNKYIDKTKIHKGDFAEIWYEEARNGFNGGYSHLSFNFNSIKQLKINGKMIYKYSWWNNNWFFVLSCLISIILIPIVIKERNRDVRKGEYAPAGPMLATILQVYPEDDDNEPTDIDYKENLSIINDENLVYDSDMNYSVYKTETSEIISVVFSDENGAYCRYFTLPDTEGKDYSQLAELARDIRNNAENYAEIEIDA